MAAAIASIRVRVPSKESLEFLDKHWDRIRNPVLDGEFSIPEQRNYMTIDPSRISHAIRGIKTETYDPNTESVVLDVVFTGPMSKPAIDEYVRGDIRLIPRCVKAKAPNAKEGEFVERIITWDLVHRPKDEDGLMAAEFEKQRQIIRKEKNDLDKKTELAKKRIKK